MSTVHELLQEVPEVEVRKNTARTPDEGKAELITRFLKLHHIPDAVAIRQWLTTQVGTSQIIRGLHNVV